MSKRIYISIGIIILSGLCVIFYTYLGGFEDLKIEKVEKTDTTIYGKSFYGLSSNTKALNTLLKEMHQYLENKTLSGKLAVCYFGNPDQKEDSIRIFVGVEQMPLIPLPKGIESIVVKKGIAVRATINAYSVAAPNPDKVNEMLREFAAQQGKQIGDFYMERYNSEKEIYSEIYLEK